MSTSRTIHVENFDSVYDYWNNNKNVTSLNVTKADLKRYAVSTGGFSNFEPNSSGVSFYESLIDMAFTSDPHGFVKGVSYDRAEQTIQRSISFFLGMISAKCIAEKKFQIKYLFHLKDPRLQVLTDGKSPDFFGVNSLLEAYIIEAKGTAKQKVSNQTVNHAKEQVASVIEVEVETGRSPQIYNRFKYQVITSCFINNQYTIQNIDPEKNEKGKGIFLIEDLVFLNYYRNVYKLLSENKTKTIELGNLNFEIMETKLGKIGVKKEIYKILKEYNEFWKVEQSFFTNKELIYLWEKANSERNDTIKLEEIYGINKELGMEKEIHNNERNHLENKVKSILGSAEIIKEINNSRLNFENEYDDEKVSIGDDGIIYIENE